ncbi:hypothetical protein PsYK624_171610 [Phanerochaete sordida]|uniref:Uncharacterized protein n=1 Tax=Phanerochaete sordida TaxID=48140 RepID=A0A9P3LMH6_9APHY|nr:hypothetical protein PsYK624_171610 [Phanerochaete sordida]
MLGAPEGRETVLHRLSPCPPPLPHTASSSRQRHPLHDNPECLQCSLQPPGLAKHSRATPFNSVPPSCTSLTFLAPPTQPLAHQDRPDMLAAAQRARSPPS